VDGSCIEQPFEETVRPGTKFRERCGISAYAVEELSGLVWAYLGPDPVPLLPRWSPLVEPEAVRDITVGELPCNWLQCQENSLDPVHTEWLHRYFGDYARQVYQLDDGTRFQGLGPTAGHPHKKIRFYDFEYGMAKARMVEGDTGEEEDWTVGHPILFPHTLVSGCQFSLIMQFRVPADDTHTTHFTLYVFPAAPGTTAPPQPFVPFRYPPMRDDLGRWDLNYNFNQDYMAWVEQGPIAQRDKENLGASDKGVIRFRRMCLEQLERLERGDEPMNVFRDPETNRSLDFPIEKIKHQMFVRPLYQPADGEPSGVAGDVGYSEDTDLIEAALATWDTIPLHARAPQPGVEPPQTVGR
jgi:5,5'-dehydrodivanillate O-demethylase